MGLSLLWRVLHARGLAPKWRRGAALCSLVLQSIATPTLSTAAAVPANVSPRTRGPLWISASP
ncbi:hypothetical protein BH24ACT15_BH24ACT15_31270 [soil metagenome]